MRTRTNALEMEQAIGVGDDISTGFHVQAYTGDAGAIFDRARPFLIRATSSFGDAANDGQARGEEVFLNLNGGLSAALDSGAPLGLMATT